MEDIADRRLPNLEADIEILKAHKNRAMGYAAGIAVVVSTLLAGLRVWVEYVVRGK